MTQQDKVIIPSSLLPSSFVIYKNDMRATEDSTPLGHRRKQRAGLKHIQQLSDFLLSLDKSTIKVNLSSDSTLTRRRSWPPSYYLAQQ